MLKQSITSVLLIIVGLGSSCLMAANNTNADDDANQPIEIHSNQAEFDDKTGVAIYTGEVIAHQGTRKLHSDVLTIYKNEQNAITHVVATGAPATMEAYMGYGEASTIRYYPDTDMMHLIGQAELLKDGNIIRGDYLTYYFQDSRLVTDPANNSRTTVIIPNE